MADDSRLASTVFVGGLTNDVTSQILHGAFIPFGTIVDISIPKPDLPSSQDPHRGFGYVEFEEPEDANEAIDNMDQSELFGKVIKVAKAKPQREQNEGLNSRVAIWEQEGYARTQLGDGAENAAASKTNGDSNNGDDSDDETRPVDPMQGLEGLDVAGPKPA